MKKFFLNGFIKKVNYHGNFGGYYGSFCIAHTGDKYKLHLLRNKNYKVYKDYIHLAYLMTGIKCGTYQDIEHQSDYEVIRVDKEFYKKYNSTKYEHTYMNLSTCENTDTCLFYGYGGYLRHLRSHDVKNILAVYDEDMNLVRHDLDEIYRYDVMYTFVLNKDG